MNFCVFNKGEECDALREKKCAGCSFYKTSEELKEGRAKAFERIEKLPLAERVVIHRKYYKT